MKWKGALFYGYSLSRQPRREITTHALITQKAYERSVLNPSRSDSVVPVLGFDRLEPAEAFDSLPPSVQPELFRVYFDDRSRTLFNGSLPVSRFVEKQEVTPMRLLAERGFVPGTFDVGMVSGSNNGWLIKHGIGQTAAHHDAAPALDLHCFNAHTLSTIPGYCWMHPSSNGLRHTA